MMVIHLPDVHEFDVLRVCKLMVFALFAIEMHMKVLVTFINTHE